MQTLKISAMKRNWIITFFSLFILQTVVSAAIWFDIPVFRQVLSLAYLLFVLGFVFIQIFSGTSFSPIEKLLLSLGLSICILMFLGLILNMLGLYFGIVSVLNGFVFIQAIHVTVIFLFILSYFNNRSIRFPSINLKFSPSMALSACLPVFSVLGNMFGGENAPSSLLLLTIGLVPVVVFVSLLESRKQQNSARWPWNLFMCTLAVLFHVSMVSNYITGFDVHVSYNIFKEVQSTGLWQPLLSSTDLDILRVNQMLNSSILPIVISNTLNLSATWVFKAIFPLIYAFMPLGIYELCRNFFRKDAAFVIAFVVLADITFFHELTSLPNQMIAELLLILSLIVIFTERIKPSAKFVLFIVLGVGLVVTHYGISYIYFILLCISFFASKILKTVSRVKIEHLLLFFSMMFAWYIFTSNSANFSSLVEIFENVQRNILLDLINPGSRATSVLTGLGLGTSTTLLHWVGRALHYIVQLLIVIGVAAISFKKAFSSKLPRDYVVMCCGIFVFVILSFILVPSLNILNTTRLYHISLILLAPIAFIGGTFVLSHFRLKATKSLLLIAIIIMGLFLFETGLIYEVTDDLSYSIPLSRYRLPRSMVYGGGYLTEARDVFGAEWLSQNVPLKSTSVVYADSISRYFVLTSYGGISRDYVLTLFNSTLIRGEKAYVFLRTFNTENGQLPDFTGGGTLEASFNNMSDLAFQLESFNTVYNNGGSEILFASNSSYSVLSNLP